MTRALIFIAAVAIVVAFCAPASAAQSKPVVGHFEAVTVTGQIRLRGDFSASEGTTTGDYLGTLCTQ
jgi:hypothetical protein